MNAFTLGPLCFSFNEGSSFNSSQRTLLFLVRVGGQRWEMGESAPDMSSADLFDHIDDFLDFPTEDIDAAVAGDGLQSWPSDDAFALGTTALAEYSGQHELSVPCDDLAELEWLSNFVEDSFSVGSVESELQSGNNGSFRTSSPVSVLESSSCSGRMLDVLPSVPGRARTKRPRPPIPLPRPAISITIANYSDTAMISSSSSTATFSGECQPEAEFFAESKPSKKGGGRKRKWSEQSAAAPRKCLHCESQKTPQWRAGPLGPKTLCNACGVRYKSGRLFPEYRPAASPTFVAEEHSNSHKKVMEMRVKRRPMGEPELVYQRNPIMSFM